MRGTPTLATPHPAEAARLLATSTTDVEADRLVAAQALATKLNAAGVLKGAGGGRRASVVPKGAGSVLAHSDGSFDINASGNPGLSTAGTGDVLSGFAGAFLAQGIDAKTALRLPVCVHGPAPEAC